MKAVVAAFNQEKALVGAFSVITNLRMELFEALVIAAHAETLGVWTHAFDNAEVTWFSPKITCECDDFCSGGGDAMRLDISSNPKWRGAWCDNSKTALNNFICEGII